MHLSRARLKEHAYTLLPAFAIAALPPSICVFSFVIEHAISLVVLGLHILFPLLRTLSVEHGTHDVAAAFVILLAELILVVLVLGFSLFPALFPKRRVKILFGRRRYGRYHVSNMRLRHWRRFVTFLDDPLKHWGDVRLLPLSCLHTPSRALSRSRYIYPVKFQGRTVQFVVAFTRQKGFSSRSPSVTNCPRTPHQSAYFDPVFGPLYGGGNGTPPPEAENRPSSPEQPDSGAPHTGHVLSNTVLARIFPPSGTSILDAASFFDTIFPFGRPGYQPSFSNSAPNMLQDTSSDAYEHDQLVLFADILYVAARHYPRLSHDLARARRSGAQSIELTPDIRVPLDFLNALRPVHRQAASLDYWHSAVDLVDSYLGDEPEGITQRNQAAVAQEASTRFPHLAYDAPLQGFAGIALSPVDLSSLLSERWLSDDTMNVALDWMSRRMGPNSPVGLANCQFLAWLRGAYDGSGGNPFRPRRPSSLVTGIQSGRLRILEFPLFVHGNHWAGIRVDVNSQTYSYRDGLHRNDTADPQDIRAVEWFLESLLPNAGGFSLQPGPARAPAPHQEDGFSCGAVLLTTLLHEHLDGAPWHQSVADMRRMEWFVWLTESTVPVPDGLASPSIHEAEAGSRSAALDTLEIFLVDDPPATDSQALAASVPSSSSSPSSSAKTLDDIFGSSPAPPPRVRRTQANRPSRKRRPANSKFHRWLREGEAALNEPSPPPRNTPLLTTFFKRLSPEEAEARRLAERAAQLEGEAERLRLAQARMQIRDLEKKAKLRTQARERKRAQRLREKLAKSTLKNSQSHHSVNEVLGRSPPIEAVASSSTSERSRPRRDFKVDLRADNKPCGRKRMHEDVEAKTVNWTNGFLFEQIMQAGREAGPRMRPGEIVKILQRRNPTDFATLTPQVLGRYIERPPNALPRWKPKVLRRAQHKGGAKPGGHTTRSGFLDGYPQLVQAIVEQLTSLRAAGVPVNLATARGIMLALIEHHAPEILTRTARDGSRFHCSDSFVRKFLFAHLRWVPRTPTRAAQKTPLDAEQQLFELFVRLVLIFRDAGIRHGELFINFDQTQVVVADPSRGTFDVQGTKQVDSTNLEEKRAWTAVVGVSSDGSVLPTQVIMKGKTDRSLPSANAPMRGDARDLGFLFSFNEKNYWSSLPLMEDYFEEIVVPYFTAQKSRLGYDEDQECVVLLDCWSVHRSKDFRDLVRRRWPWIRLRYVPGGMTGLAQPCDVGIQRPFKLSIKRSQLQDVVAETLAHLQANANASELRLDTRIGTLRDRSVSWFVKAWRDINEPQLVKKAFEHCKVRGGFNLSFESITSSAALKLVRELPRTDPELWQKICADYGVEDAAGNDDLSISTEDLSPFGDEPSASDDPAGQVVDDEGILDDSYIEQDDDDTAIAPADLMSELVGQPQIAEDARLGMAEQLDPTGQSARPKRRRLPNSLYKDYVYDSSAE